jgi:hypothetical protein
MLGLKGGVLHTTVYTDTPLLQQLNDSSVLNVRIVGLCIVTQKYIQTPHTYRN